MRVHLSSDLLSCSDSSMSFSIMNVNHEMKDYMKHESRSDRETCMNVLLRLYVCIKKEIDREWSNFVYKSTVVVLVKVVM